jgi:3-polyprenyl-4-hydroxybenzoate decarboxylase
MKLGSSRRWLERHLILSQWAEITFLKEASLCARDIGAFASVLRSRVNQGAVLASGSSRHDGMILAAR